MYIKLKQIFNKRAVALLVAGLITFFAGLFLILENKKAHAFNGSGTVANPYVISTKADLKLLQSTVGQGTNYFGNYFVLGQNINMEGDAFPSIGNSIVNSFAGNFDGRGFSIYNLSVMKANVDQADSYNGLFGNLYGATISNLNVENIRLNVSAKSGENGAAGGANLDGKNGNSAATDLYTGGIAGYAIYSKIINSYVDGSITVIGGSGGNGGLAGTRNVNGDGTNGGDGADGKDIYIGGLVGRAVDTEIVESGFSGSIIGIGGNAGSGGNGGAYRGNSFTTGGNGGNAGQAGAAYVGGIVGHISESELSSVLNKNYSSSEIYIKAGEGGSGGNAGNGRTIGGAGGANSLGGAIYSGGIVGESSISVLNSFTEGTIEIQAEPKGIYGFTAAGTTPGPNGENVLENQQFIVGGIAGVMSKEGTSISSSYTTIEAIQKHDYNYFNDIHVRIAGIAGMISANDVALTDNVVLSRTYTAEVEIVDEGEMIRSIASFATYQTQEQMESSILKSLRNKNIDMFLFTENTSHGSEWVYTDGDDNSTRASLFQIMNNPGAVFETFDTQAWTINAEVNGGYPTFNNQEFKKFDYTKTVYIGSYQDLKNLADRNNLGYSYYGQTIYITNDIAMDSTIAWEPIGKDFRTAFQGKVVGQNKKIEPLIITKAIDYKGLFGYTSRLSLSNLTILDPSYSSNSGSYVGGFIGYNLFDATLENLNVILTGSTYGNNSVIKGNRIIGGVAGQLDGLKNTVTGVSNTSNIVATNTPFASNQTYAGGLFGKLGRTHMQKSYNVGNVTINASTTPQMYAGGMIGFIDSGFSKIENSFNVGNVSGGVHVSGGIGGLSEKGHGTVVDKVYVAGEIAATYSATALTSNTSPIIGQAHYNVTISNSVNALSKLTINTKQSPRYIGKLISFVAPHKIVSTSLFYTRDTFTNTNNYYNTNSVNTASAGTNHAYYYDVTAQSIGKTFVEIATQDFFEHSARFDFGTIWEHNPEINNGLPYFKGQGEDSGFESQPGYGNNPIQIKDMNDLIAFRDEVNSGKKYIGQTITLANHINMGGINWTPIGISATNYFGGTFDGQNYSISGLFIDKTTAYKGLFGYAINATFKNVHISSPAIVSRAGADTGALLGRGTTNIIIDNVHITGGYVKSTANNVGGIVGYLTTNSHISNSSTTEVNVMGALYVGGIIGYSHGTVAHTSITITDTFSASHVKGSGNGVGGISGFMRGGRIERVYTTGSIISMDGYSGGIVGVAQSNGITVANAMVKGNVYSNRASSTATAGGVVGNVAVASNYYNILVTGNIRSASSLSSTGNYSSTAGGIVGFGNVANITVNNSAVMSKEVIGVGELIKWNGSHPIGAGRDSNRPSGGGIIGSETNIYLDTMTLGPLKGLTTAQLSSVVAAAKPESAFYNIGSYYSIGWGTNVIAEDNSAIWNIDPNINEGLPYLTKFGEITWPKGSIKNPHTISSKAELAALATDVNSGNPYGGQYIEVVEDFEIGDWMIPIGLKFAEGFSGIFDGNLHTLSKLRNPGNRAGIFGLFGALVQAEVKNLILSDVNLTLTTSSSSGDRVGAVAGQSHANSRISNVAVTSGSITSPALYIGGLVGYAHSLEIDKSYSALTVKGGGRVGGLTGIFFSGKITKSYSTGDVSATLGNNHSAGGLIGQISGNVTVQDSYSRGAVSDTSTSTHAYAGGIVGLIQSTVAVMDRVYATGDITAHTTWSSTSSGNGAYAGGIAGMSNLASSAAGVRITNSISYSNKIVASVTRAHTAQSNYGVGASVTTVSRIATGENSWYLDTVERGVAKGVAGAAVANTYMSAKSQEFLLNQTNLSNAVLDGGVGWDFEQTWSMKESVNDGYPYLNGLIPNRSDLKNLLITAQKYEKGEWLESLYSIFETKLNNAQVIYEKNDATFEELDTAYIELDTAIKNLRGDTRELQTIYNQFYEDNTVIDTDENNQTKEIFLSYLFKNWGIVESALASAKLILDEDSNAYNNSYINNSRNVLTAAIAGLVVDKTELQKLINEVNELKEENYDILVWIELDRARLHALKVNNNDGLIAGTQDIYFAIKGLELAMGDLVLDTNYLQNLISQAEGYIQGINPSKFTASSYAAYSNAITQAKLITNESSVESLNQAIFNLSVEMTNLMVDKSSLQINITLADSKNRTHYTNASFIALETALEDAKTFAALPRPKLTEFHSYISQLDIANNALVLALENLEVNTQQLHDVLVQAKAEQNDDLIYTPESWQTLQDAILDAEQAILEGLENFTAQEITDLVENVKNAILDLEINKAFMIDLIQSAKSISKGYYNETTFNNLQVAISVGEATLSSPTIDITEVRNGMQLIKQSILALKIDVKIIEDFVDKVENPFNDDYYKPTDWSTETYSNLVAVKEEAKTILQNEESDNAVLLDIIKRIENAILNLVADKSELDLLINELSSWVNTKYRQDNEGNFILDDNGNLKQFLVYSAGTWRNLQDAIAQAKITQHSNLTTKQDIEDEIANLEMVVDNLRVDMSELEYKIQHAEDLLKEVLKYTADSLALLEQSKDQAQEALLVEKLTLSELQLVLDDLVSKINNLEVDRSSIRDLIALANSLLRINYTENTWIPFEYTRDYVNSIIDAPGLTADDVINFYNNLENAMYALRPRKDNLIALMLYASGLEAIYMAETSFINLQEKIVEATTVINNLDAMLADVTAAQNTLQSAIDAIIPTKTELQRLIGVAQETYYLNYTEESILNLKELVAEASLVNLDTEASIDEIISVASSLIYGVEGLIVNTLELQVLIDAIKTELETEYDEKPASNFYVESKYNNLLEKLTAAERIDDSIKLEEYNIILQNLKDAKAGLIVNKSQLAELIAQAQGINQTLYEATGISILNSKLDAGIVVFENDSATIPQFLTVTSELQTALNNLEYDITALESLRTQAEAILADEANYTAGSIADLLTAYNKSEDYEIENYIEICLELEARISEVVSIKSLKEKIASAKTFIENNMSDYETETLAYYTVHFSRLVTAYNEATDLVTNRYLPQQEADRLVNELTYQPYMIYIGGLKEAYSVAIMADEDLYSRTSFEKLKIAIESARLVLEEPESSQEQVDTVQQEVVDAIAGLEALMYTIQLEELYNDVVHYQAQDYTASTYADFALYMLQAESIINNPEASQMVAMEVLNMLQDAILNLVEIKQLREIIAQLEEIKPLGYTQSSFQTFSNSLNQAKQTVEIANLTKEQVAEALATLQNAKGGLVVDKSQLQTLYNRVRYYQQTDFAGGSDFANFKTQLQNAQNALQSSITGDILIALINLNEAVLALVVQDAPLLELFALAKQINQDDYLFGYTEFVTKANQIESEYFALDYVSLEQYKTYYNELYALKDDLVFDNTLLLSLILQANQIMENQQDYSLRSIDALRTQIIYAQTFIPELDDYEEVCNALSQAIDNTVYLKGLRQVLATAKQFEADNLDDYINNKLNYFEKGFTYLRNTIIEADAALRDSNITNQRVDQLVDGLDIGKNLISILPLREAINRAETLNQEKYTSETYQEVKNAITFANNVTGNYNSNLDDVNQAIDRINLAIDGLIYSMTEGQNLVNWFDELNPLHYESGFEQLENEVNNLRTIIQRVLSNEDVAHEDYENAVSKVIQKQENLVHNSKQSLQDLVDEYLSKEYLYTTESFAEFKVFLQNAKQKIETNMPMLVSEIQSEVDLINENSSILVLKSSSGMTKISVIEENKTFKFYDINGNAISKSEHEYSGETAYLTNIAQGERVSTVLSQFKNTDLKVYDRNGNQITNLTNLRASTGQEIRMYDDFGNITDSITIVVKGDTNRDGNVNIFDIARLTSLISSTESSVIDMLAADMTGDGRVNIFDLARISIAIVGDTDIYEDIRLGEKI